MILCDQHIVNGELLKREAVNAIVNRTSKTASAIFSAFNELTVVTWLTIIPSYHSQVTPYWFIFCGENRLSNLVLSFYNSILSVSLKAVLCY